MTELQPTGNSAPPLILLHGWGFSSRSWQPLIQALSRRDIDNVYALDLPGFGSSFHETATTLDDLLAWIETQLPAQCVLCGWSLGGMLATQLAASFPQQVVGLITLGSNLHFTQDADWPGMPAGDYAQFCARFAAQPQKTWQRFLALQTRGETLHEASTDTLAQLATFDDIEPLTANHLLRILGEIDNRTTLEKICCNTLHLLGEHDAITPHAIASRLCGATTHDVITVNGASHALPLLHAEDIARHMADFLATLQNASASTNSDNHSNHSNHDSRAQAPIQRQRIAHSFSRAANHYVAAAKLQRDVSAALTATLPATLDGTVIDLGCGTGFVTAAVLQKTAHTPASASRVIALDIASGMLQKIHADFPAALRVQADMAALPLQDHCADWLLSSLALQWVANLHECLHEWRRILKSGGQLRFSTLLPGTLRELQQSWQAVDDKMHVNRFVAENALLAALQQAGFTQIETLRATHTLYYAELTQLARDLKTIGAHNMNNDQPRGLTGKQRWAQLIAAYETFRTARGLPASYEVLYVSAS